MLSENTDFHLARKYLVLFSSPYSCLTFPSGGTPCNIKVIYALLESTFITAQIRILINAYVRARFSLMNLNVYSWTEPVKLKVSRSRCYCDL